MQISTPEQLVAAYEKFGGLKAITRETKTPWSRVHTLYTKAVANRLMDPLPLGHKTREHMGDIAKGRVKVTKPKLSGSHRPVKAAPLPLKAGKVTRFLFTSAQNNTRINEAFWTNLLALKKHYDAELHISYFAYIKEGLGARGDKNLWMNGGDPTESQKTPFWFDKRLEPYASNTTLRVAKGLVWCGEQNILPTDARPLSKVESMTGRDSCIIPHVKVAMDSVAAAKGEATKFLYTTGTVTQRNYIMRKSGRIADFHHSYAALLVEVDENQNWWCRQIIADNTGTLYDIDPKGKKCLRVSAGNVSTGHRADSIAWGDIHDAQMAPVVRKLAFGRGGMLDALQPYRQFWHDWLDFHFRNHHDIDDEFTMYQRHVLGKESVRQEVLGCVAFYGYAGRPWCETIAVNSNHDRALMRWIRDKKVQPDPINLRFRSAMRDRLAAAIEERRDFIAFKEAFLYVTGKDTLPKGLRFLDEDESYLVCRAGGNGIEMGMHGDRGPNGGKGSRLAFTKMGRRCVIGHSHSAGIADGVYQTGTCSIFDPDYAKGPSSWSHSHVVVYPNGKRAIITMFNGKWHA